MIVISLFMIALTGLPIGYSVIVALTGLPIGYSVIVALTGLPIYRIQCISSSNRSPYRIQCISSSNRSPYRIQCISSSNRSNSAMISSSPVITGTTTQMKTDTWSNTTSTSSPLLQVSLWCPHSSIIGQVIVRRKQLHLSSKNSKNHNHNYLIHTIGTMQMCSTH